MPAKMTALLSVLLTVAGQVLLKLGIRQMGAVDISQLPTKLPAMLTNPWIFLGLSIYACSAILWLSALSRLDLGYAYPLISLGIVLVFLISWLLLDETYSSKRLIGSAVIIAGLLIMR